MTTEIFKSLIIGDIHAKFWVLEKIKPLILEYDKLIFLGDYVDDWTAPPEASYNLLKELIDLKLKYPSKIVLLLGNHDTSEAFAGCFRCSGFNEQTHSLVKDLYKTRDSGNVPIFNVAYSKGNYLFTHAGITKNFWQDILLLIKNHYPELSEIINLETNLATKISNILNYALLKGLDDPLDKLFLTLSQIGIGRGGRQTPSPLWADKSELIENPVPKLHQVVGHTPVNTIIQTKIERRYSLTFCDTLSTSYNPYFGLETPFGDKSLLEMRFGQKVYKKIIPKSDWLWT